MKNIVTNALLVMICFSGCSIVHDTLQQIAKDYSCQNIRNIEDRRECESRYSQTYEEYQRENKIKKEYD